MENQQQLNQTIGKRNYWNLFWAIVFFGGASVRIGLYFGGSEFTNWMYITTGIVLFLGCLNLYNFITKKK